LGHQARDLVIGIKEKKEILNVQIYLKNLGYEPGKTDGLYGTKTINEIKKIKKIESLNLQAN